MKISASAWIARSVSASNGGPTASRCARLNPSVLLSGPMARRPKPDRRRALELLASCKDDCTEGILRAKTGSRLRMAELVRAKLASATAERVVAGSTKMEIARVRITDAGRQRLGE